MQITPYKGLSSHIRQKHRITSKEYYDIYFKQENEGICLYVTKKPPFLKLSKAINLVVHYHVVVDFQ